MARTRQLCAICSDRVDSRSLSAANAERTSAAVSLRSCVDPIWSTRGRTPSRQIVRVRSDRPGSPSLSQSSTQADTV